MKGDDIGEDELVVCMFVLRTRDECSLDKV